MFDWNAPARRGGDSWAKTDGKPDSDGKPWYFYCFACRLLCVMQLVWLLKGVGMTNISHGLEMEIQWVRGLLGNLALARRGKSFAQRGEQRRDVSCRGLEQLANAV